MKGLFALLAMSFSLLLAKARAAHTPPDRKVYALAAPVAIPQVTAELPVVIEHQLVLLATCMSAIESTAAVATLIPVTVAAVVAPPNTSGAKVSLERRARSNCAQKVQPYTTILHPEPGRQRR